MRVAVVAEWYPSPADPVLGVWAHRQALAAQAAGAEVRVLAMRRPIPPLAAARAALRVPPELTPLRTWAAGVRSSLRPLALDGIDVTPVPWVAPPRPVSYGSWGHWMAPPLARALDRLHARWPFDVLHAHSIVPPGYAAARWVDRRRRTSDDGAPPALVVSAHGPDMIHVHRLSRLAARASRRALRSADLVVANSRWARERCEQIAGGPLPARVVHLGADVPRPERLPARHATPTLVTVAHLVERKRHANVLRALARLRPQHRPDYVVIGDGPCRPALEALARELGIAGQVRFLGQLPHERALAELARCHVLAMPGIEEPFGVAFVEGMAAGLPAIGSRGEGGPEDIAAAGEGMTLVAPDDVAALADALRELLADADQLARRGAAARATVERRFTWERCGAVTLDAYREAVAHATATPDAMPSEAAA
jgi:teichuronic acid biosynthesis glycosyltransferase TuaC